MESESLRFLPAVNPDQLKRESMFLARLKRGLGNHFYGDGEGKTFCWIAEWTPIISRDCEAGNGLLF